MPRAGPHRHGSVWQERQRLVQVRGPLQVPRRVAGANGAAEQSDAGVPRLGLRSGVPLVPHAPGAGPRFGAHGERRDAVELVEAVAADAEDDFPQLALRGGREDGAEEELFHRETAAGEHVEKAEAGRDGRLQTTVSREGRESSTDADLAEGDPVRERGTVRRAEDRPGLRQIHEAEHRAHSEAVHRGRPGRVQQGYLGDGVVLAEHRDGESEGTALPSRGLRDRNRRVHREIFERSVHTC